MELQNDPRFFHKNVIDKRLAALKNLTIVSSLMLGTALGHCFSLKKEYHFEGRWECTGVSILQIISFLLLLRIVFVCFFALYTFCQQLYHIYRLMTSGPTGVELAGEYYLNPSITLWRHTAVNRLLKMFRFFIMAVGLIIFVSMMKDGGTVKECYAKGGGSKKLSLQDVTYVVVSMMRNVTYTTPAPPVKKKYDTFEEVFQPTFAFLILSLFLLCAYVLHHIHQTHCTVFDTLYAKLTSLLPATRKWAESSRIENHEVSAEPVSPRSAMC
jgi:hypothetical protein